MGTVELDNDGNLIEEETSPEQLISPGSPDINNVVGNPQISTRVGEEYQVEIPDMITEVEYFRLTNSADSEGNVDVSHSFLVGLPVPITWIHEKVMDERFGCQSKLNDAATVNGFLKSRKRKKGHSPKKSKDLYLGDEQSGYGLDDEKQSNSVKLGPGITSNAELLLSCKGKNSRPVPGSSADYWSNSWSDTEVDVLLLGLYIFGKDFDMIKRLLENKDMGEILSFYYRKFYKSDAYLSWFGRRKRKNKKFFGKKIFTGWILEELSSRLLMHIPEELKNASQEVSKTYAEGKMSFDDYFFSLKDIFGLRALVEAVGIGKGKADLISLAMESPKTNQAEIPSGKACSSLTSSDIIRFLTGDFRLSKARSHDIFWEAIWPRLLARGWHSEQPKYQWSVSSKHHLVFLIPGVKKFSRRKLVKGDHYFDSVTDILSKVASEPNLLELDADGVGLRSCNEEDGRVLEEPLDQDDPSHHKRHCYLKPQVSSGSLSHVKFTIVDSSLTHGGKPSKVREMTYSPIDLKISSKSIHQENEALLFEASIKANANDIPSGGEKRVSNVQQAEGIVCRFTEDNPKFTIVDTSSVHGGKSAKVSKLRYLPVGFKISPEMSGSSGMSEGNSSGDSSEEHEPSSTDGLLNGDLVADNTTSKGSPGAPYQLLGAHMNLNKTRESTVCTDGNSYQKRNKSCTAENRVETDQDEKINKLDDKKSKRIIKHQFSRRAKSASSFAVAPPVKRRRLTACAKTEKRCLPENLALDQSSEQAEPSCALKSPNSSSNSVVQEGYSQKILLPGSSAESNAENKGMPPATCEKSQFQLSIDLNLPQVPLDSGDEPLMMEGEELMMNSRRKSTRNRPLTTRVLEAFENGFLPMDRRQKSREQSRGIPFSIPSRKARSRVKATANRGAIAIGTGDVMQGGEGAFFGNKDVADKPPHAVEVAHQDWQQFQNWQTVIAQQVIAMKELIPYTKSGDKNS
ncbi:hypothetical protein SLA2020_038220 [Shorea laevis]